MPAWPSILPQKPHRGQWSEDVRPDIAAFRPESDPPLVRRRGTVTTFVAKAVYRMTNEQVADFMVWHGEELHGGALRFDMAHPVTSAAAQWAFEGPYSYIDDDVYDVSVTLRRLPWGRAFAHLGLNPARGSGW